jgi:hypothetical protein
LPTAKPDSNNQERHVLEAPVVRIRHGYSVQPWQPTDRKIKDLKDHLFGWIRFDDKDKTDIGNLRCVIIAQQKPTGWMGLGQDGWKNFADRTKDKSWNPSKVSYVLMVSNAAREQGYKLEVCRRLGVAAIESVYLLSSSPPQTVWVI